MYLPRHFDASADRDALDALLAAAPFVTLVSQHEGAPFATHLPVLARRDATGTLMLIGHWARGNPQWQGIEGQRVLVIAQGPHAYVSPTWYPDPQAAVPTWNYASAHLYGTLRVVSEREPLLALVDTLARHFEHGPRPWRMDDAREVSERMVAGIVGFELTVERAELKWKLSQNHARERVQGVIDGLRAAGGEEAAATAELMARALAARG